MAAYYNEIDPYAAQWLRNLIAAGHIAPGEVDERSIEDVHPDDLKPYTQCHFFAGVGVWSYALRRAGWPDDRPVWTGSCPCQPFSAAGAGAGFDDQRHLWPHFHWLISQRHPAELFGEQVASKDAEPWLDLVQADLEAMDYAFGAVAFPSAGVGAPHIRDRTYWVADANRIRQSRPPRGKSGRIDEAGTYRHSGPGRLAYSSGVGRREECPDAGRESIGDQSQRGPSGSEHGGSDRRPEPVNGLWADADWLFCRDGKWRPVEPGTFPLAHGAPGRVGRLRAYGNAINAEAATQFIAAYLETL
ncbi:DNA cytosine methyltransferase [Pseudomonas mosselii]|uniref:DNA cytosine methyltransferase n=1 Tax=Pseudomonas mosselii TaxID=78327 RepID=UPI000C12DE7D|nr:DNA cytosine methyltransferase [Pseudomonas mosselii]